MLAYNLHQLHRLKLFATCCVPPSGPSPLTHGFLSCSLALVQQSAFPKLRANMETVEVFVGGASDSATLAMPLDPPPR